MFDPVPDCSTSPPDYTGLALQILEQPDTAGPAAPGDCAAAFVWWASLAYSRPDLLNETAVRDLTRLFVRPDLPPDVSWRAGEVIQILLTTPVARIAVDAILETLRRPELSPEMRQAIFRALEFAVLWACALLDLASLA